MANQYLIQFEDGDTWTTDAITEDIIQGINEGIMSAFRYDPEKGFLSAFCNSPTTIVWLPIKPSQMLG